MTRDDYKAIAEQAVDLLCSIGYLGLHPSRQRELWQRALDLDRKLHPAFPPVVVWTGEEGDIHPPRRPEATIKINNPQVKRPWPYDGPEGRARLTGSLDTGGSFTGEDDDDSGERHVIYCRGCRKAWTEMPPRRPFADPPVDEPSACACACKPGDPQYEDWAVDPDPSEIPEGAWS